MATDRQRTEGWQLRPRVARRLGAPDMDPVGLQPPRGPRVLERRRRVGRVRPAGRAADALAAAAAAASMRCGWIVVGLETGKPRQAGLSVLAEPEGFEPSMQVLPAYSLSRGAPSASRSQLRNQRGF